jgi:ribosome-binding factor A
MDSTRQNKIARQLQKDLGEIFQELGRDALQGRMVTVTTVRISPDLSLAKVYLSIFPSENMDDYMTDLRKNIKQIRHSLGIRVRNQLRIVPEIALFVDDSLDYADRIEQLLKK